MALMHSPEYESRERTILLTIARRSIEHGIREGIPLLPESDTLPDSLTRIRASFVTLRKADDLRGCIGTLNAHRPLAEDVAGSAFSSAFRDPRFPPLREREFAGLSIEVSVLSPMQPLFVTSEAELLHALRPGIDGLVIEEGSHSATFLPTVWESLPKPRAFVNELRRKAGLPEDYWSANLALHTYHTETFAGPA